jgi:hypothetical protein
MKLSKILNVLCSTIIIIGISVYSCLAAVEESETKTALQSETKLMASSATKPFDWAIGLQYTRPSSGISLIYPLDADFSLQPIFYIDVNHNTTESLAYGLRGIYKLTTQPNINPYLGFGLGRNYHLQNPSSTVSVGKGGEGCEAFFGVVYNKYLLRPSIEIALGAYERHNGDYDAGITLNIAAMYYFQL